MVKMLLKAASVLFKSVAMHGAVSVLPYTLIPGPKKQVLMSQVPPWALHLNFCLISIIWSLLALGTRHASKSCYQKKKLLI